mgnify:FL=1
MNYFLLADTEFFRRINEAGDCNMETAYMAFANQVIELCGSIHASHTAIALAYIEIELQHHPVRLLSEERKEAAAYIGKALSFVRKMQKFLTTPQVPPLISNIHPTHITAAKSETPKSLQWTGNTLDLVELIYGLSEMGCIDNGETPLKVLAPALYEFFGLDTKECYRYYSAIKLRKNPSRTYFIDKMQKKLNEKIRRDEELERMRR